MVWPFLSFLSYLSPSYSCPSHSPQPHAGLCASSAMCHLHPGSQTLPRFSLCSQLLFTSHLSCLHCVKYHFLGEAYCGHLPLYSTATCWGLGVLPCSLSRLCAVHLPMVLISSRHTVSSVFDSDISQRKLFPQQKSQEGRFLSVSFTKVSWTPRTVNRV